MPVCRSHLSDKHDTPACQVLSGSAYRGLCFAHDPSSLRLTRPSLIRSDPAPVKFTAISLIDRFSTGHRSVSVHQLVHGLHTRTKSLYLRPPLMLLYQIRRMPEVLVCTFSIKNQKLYTRNQYPFFAMYKHARVFQHSAAYHA